MLHSWATGLWKPSARKKAIRTSQTTCSTTGGQDFLILETALTSTSWSLLCKCFQTLCKSGCPGDNLSVCQSPQKATKLIRQQSWQTVGHKHPHMKPCRCDQLWSRPLQTWPRLWLLPWAKVPGPQINGIAGTDVHKWCVWPSLGSCVSYQSPSIVVDVSITFSSKRLKKSPDQIHSLIWLPSLPQPHLLGIHTTARIMETKMDSIDQA